MECPKCGNKTIRIVTTDHTDKIDVSKMTPEKLEESYNDGEYDIDFCDSDIYARCTKCDSVVYSL